MKLHQISQMLDLSAVRAESTHTQIQAAAHLARAYQCIAVFALPAHTVYLHQQLQGSAVLTGGVVGFPGGAETTDTKVFTAQHLLASGCQELDMVNNIAWLKANNKAAYLDDVRTVVEVAQKIPVKVILECHWLTTSEIIRACEWATEAGAKWVKSSTGWAPGGATLEDITLMRQSVGLQCGVKAAGGIKNLDTLLELYHCGARRFGVGVASAQKILTEAQQALDE